MTLNLEQYRDETDRFLAALDEELYLHGAGHKDELELAPIYDRFAELITLSTARELRDLVAIGEPVVELWRFACEEYLERLVADEREETARLQATLDAVVDGARIPYHMLYFEITNEPDRARRERLDHARVELVKHHLDPLLVDAFTKVRAALPELGASNGRELYTQFGFDLSGLAGSCAALLAETQTLYEDVFGALVERRLGLPLGEIARYDVTRLWRAPEWDSCFPCERIVPALEETLAELGIQLRAQPNIELDIDDRPSKDPRPFCSPIEVPDRVLLVLKPLGGLEDWRGLFHEAGHAEHFAHMRKSLPVEARKLGDNAVTEGFAFLMELLVDDPVWLRRRLDVDSVDDLVRESAAMRLYLVRRYCGKLLYEIELYGNVELEAMPERYRKEIASALGIDSSPWDYLIDTDRGFYSTCYLRAWAVEAQLSSHLTEQFGPAWFTHREAGALLRELWHEGQGMSADELVAQVTGQPLDLTAIGERIRSRLA